MKRIAVHYLIFGLLLFAIKTQAQGIKEFYIECNMDEFEYMYENYSEEIYIPIIIEFDGNSWSDVRMRIRGDGSKELPKKSLKVIFDDELFTDGQDALNFNAEYGDNSYLHSVLSSRVFNDAGIDCANMEHIRVYLNGGFFGLYVLIENMDKLFLENHGFNIYGNLYKATKDGACLSINDNVFYHWEKKLDNVPSRDDLSNLIYELNYTNDNNFCNVLQTSFVYSRITSLIALNMLLANGSTYYHNYYIYNDENDSGKWFIFPWDLDKTFSSYSKWYVYHRSSYYWTPDNPLLERSIIVDEAMAEIRSKITILKNTVFNENYLFPIIDSIVNVIGPSVLQDSTDNIPDMVDWVTNIEHNKDFISERYIHLMYNIDNAPRNFKINRLPGYYLPNHPITISWDPSSDPNGNNIFYNLYYGSDMALEDPTTVIVQGLTDTSYTFDDISIEGKYYYKVEATDNSLNILGFDSYNQFFISPGIPDLVINEICYNSQNGFDSGDWVEVFNPSDSIVDLSGWYFKDENNQHVFNFPAGVTIGPKGYKVLCKDTLLFLNLYSETISILGNMGFGLSSTGELLRLYHYTGYLVDSLVYGINYPWPVSPNGDGPTLELLNPGLDNAIGHNWKASVGYGTPGKQNSSYSPDSYLDFVSNPVIVYQNYPNPFSDYTKISYQLKVTSDVRLKIFNLSGNTLVDEVFYKQMAGLNTFTWKTSDLVPGYYYYQIIIDGKIVGNMSAIKK